MLEAYDAIQRLECTSLLGTSCVGVSASGYRPSILYVGANRLGTAPKYWQSLKGRCQGPYKSTS